MRAFDPGPPTAISTSKERGRGEGAGGCRTMLFKSAKWKGNITSGLLWSILVHRHADSILQFEFEFEFESLDTIAPQPQT